MLGGRTEDVQRLEIPVMKECTLIFILPTPPGLLHLRPRNGLHLLLRIQGMESVHQFLLSRL